MTTLTIKAGTKDDDFFKRGRQLARAADAGEELPDERIVSFEDPAEVIKLLTSSRLELFREVKERPGSVSQIAECLQRDRNAVKRDVDELERAGLVTISDEALPGSGRKKVVRATATRVLLRVEIY